MSPKFWEYLAWSFTRHRTFGSCPRQYWFQYIGPNDYEVPSGNRDQLWKLKGLEALSFLRGKIVHEQIEKLLPTLVTHEFVDEDSVLAGAAERVESARAEAGSRVVEFQNGVPYSDALFDKIRTDVIEQMSTFLRVIWPPLSSLEYVQHEKFDHFKLEKVPVTVKLDCVLKQADGHLVIIDWKTGNDDEKYESRLQLASYATWAGLEKGAVSIKPEIRLVFLKTAHARRIELSDGDLQGAKSTMLSDWDEFSHPKSFESYPARPEQRMCTSCRFAVICPDACLSSEVSEAQDD